MESGITVVEPLVFQEGGNFVRLQNLFVVASIVWSAAAVPAFGQEVLDQQYAPPGPRPNLGANVNEGVKLVGQTFTAGQSGALTRVNMDFWRLQSGLTDFEFTIRATTGGLPIGAPLATEVIPHTAIPTATETVLGSTSLNILFDPAPILVAGQQYALVVQSPLRPPGAGQATGIWGGSTDGSYALGQPVVSSDNLVWTPQSWDLFFRTYVTVPEPTVIAPLALACALLLRRRRSTP